MSTARAINARRWQHHGGIGRRHNRSMGFIVHSIVIVLLAALAIRDVVGVENIRLRRVVAIDPQGIWTLYISAGKRGIYSIEPLERAGRMMKG